MAGEPVTPVFITEQPKQALVTKVFFPLTEITLVAVKKKKKEREKRKTDG